MAIKLTLGQDWTTCMRQQMASKAAGGPYNPAACSAFIPPSTSPRSAAATPSDSGVPTWVWIGVGALAVGGAAWYFLLR